MRLREKVAQQLPLRRKNTGRIVEDYVFLCIYASRRNALNSAESGFRQRVCHALRPVGSFSAAPAVTGVLCPDVPGGRPACLSRTWVTTGGCRPRRLRTGSLRRPRTPGMLGGHHNGP